MRKRDSVLLNLPFVTSCIVKEWQHYFRSNSSKNGTFTSPNYPDPYPPDSTVRYIFQGVPGETVQVTFTDVDLHYTIDANSVQAE